MQSSPMRAPARMWALSQTLDRSPIRTLGSTIAVGWILAWGKATPYSSDTEHLRIERLEIHPFAVERARSVRGLDDAHRLQAIEGRDERRLLPTDTLEEMADLIEE